MQAAHSMAAKVIAAATSFRDGGPRLLRPVVEESLFASAT